MNPRYAPMFAPYTLNNGVAIKNRFVVAPLTIYESDANGGLTDAARNFWTRPFSRLRAVCDAVYQCASDRHRFSVAQRF